MQLFHGSNMELAPGTVLTPQKGYRWAEMRSAIALEAFRPKKARPHKDSVFMMDSLEQIYETGAGATGASHFYAVEPIGDVARHDFTIHEMIEDAFDEYGINPTFFKEELKGERGARTVFKDLSLAYWLGEENPVAWDSDPIWEYTAPQAKVIQDVSGELHEEIVRIKTLAGLR